MKNSLFTIIILIFFSTGVFSQSGSLRGKILDESTGEELIGATIVVENTTNGAITDFDGNYSIDNLTAGTYNFRFSFISYQTLLVNAVEIKAGEVTVINIALKQEVSDIEEVVVVARAITQTETSVITLQRKSATVLDGISAQQMSRLGDGDAAGALKRVTGISVEGGKYVYVRGLSDRYSKTVLNNAEIPGLDPDKNTVQMDMFPSNMIENIIVHKTFSPDLPGSFTGGFVNIVTKDFPDKFTLQFSTTLGYNPQTNFNNSFLSYEGGKYDILGFDDGSRSIPNIAENQIPARFENDVLLNTIGQSFNKNMQVMNSQAGINHSHSFSVGNQTKLFGKQIGFNVGFSYGHDYSSYNNGMVGRYKLLHPDNETLNGEIILNDQKGTEEVIWSGLANLNYKLSNNHMIGLVLVRNQSGASLARVQDGTKNSDEAGMPYYTQTMQYLQRSFTSYQLKGEHVFEGFHALNIEWISSYTNSAQDEPDLRFFTYHQNDGGVYEISQSLYPVPTRFFRNMTENNFDNKIDITLPFQINGYLAKTKFGGAFVAKNRTFVTREFTFSENSNSFNGNISDYFADENIDAQNGLFVTNSVNSDNKNSYDATQTVAAAYSLFDATFGSLRILTGVRFEKTIMNTTSRKAGLKEGNLDNNDFLPSLNITYHIADKINVRTAYTRTLARPSFRELAPYASIDFVGDFVKIGNPYLKRTLIDNIDIRWEYYMNSGEIMSVSVFYKQFENPIERTFNTEAANPELTWRNVAEADMYGIELEIRKSLDFIDFLKDVKVGGNYTFVKSQVSIDEKELESKRYFNPDFSSKRVMAGQSPYIFNAYITYECEKNGINANLGYNTTGKQLYLVNAEGVPDIYEQSRHQLDFTFSKKIGESLSLKVGVKNILDSQYRQTYEYNNQEYIYSQYSLGRTYSLGFNYLIN